MKDKKKVVIIGAGFAGLSVAKSLIRSSFEITLIDKKNHHLFQPLLYQVATAGLSPAQIAAPIRAVFQGAPNCHVFLEEVVSVDVEKQIVYGTDMAFPYDYVVIATGAIPNYFGHSEWEKTAPSLKEIEDATRVRRLILNRFELAENETDAKERQNLMTFAVVGGGPTGVELAGAISELARFSLVADFRTIDPSQATIYLIEAGPQLLPGFSEDLAEKAKKRLEAMNVRILTNERVTSLSESCVTTDQRELQGAACIWAAGVKASPAAEWIDAKTDKAGRIFVDEYLRWVHKDNVFIIGDVAHAKDDKGVPLPGIAPVALQQGEYVARYLKNSQKVKPFRYRDKGMLATIGRSYAVGKVGRWKFSGFVAWVVWSIVHLLYLIGFRNRLLVMMDWIWSYFTYERGARLIVGPKKPRRHR